MKQLAYIKRPKIYYGSNFNSDLFFLLRKYNFEKKNAILLTGLLSFRKTEYYQVLKNLLTEAQITIIREAGIDQNPTLSEIGSYKKIKTIADIIICIGGGSVIDFGKAIKLHYYKNAQILAIYTLPGSASIVTPFAIFDNDEFKIGEHSEEIIPNYVYINKKIISDLPTDLIKKGMFDVLTHITESFISKASTKESKIHALKALTFLENYIESDFKDIFLLNQADIFAGLSEKVGLILFPHAIGHYLTYKYKIPHSLATMYFFEKFITLLQSKGLVIPKKMETLIDMLNSIFLKNYKNQLVLKGIEINESYKLIEKYMPFIFTNSPVVLNKRDYISLYNEYKKN